MTSIWEEIGQRVLEDLDLHVLRDLYCPSDCQQCRDEVDHTGAPCFYIGVEEELDAGLYGCSAEAPTFSTVAAAHEWAGRNESELRRQFPERDVEEDVRRDMDPAQGPLFWLCLPIVLVCVVGKVALAWLKTKLPSRKAYYRCCRDCGWRLSWDAASLICPPCQEARRQRSHSDCDCHCHREMDVVNACGDCGFGDDLRIADFNSGGAR